MEGIENLTGLTKLLCGLKQLKYLDVSGLTNLKELYCSDGQLAEINAGRCTNLERIDCMGNQLSKINVDGCSRLLGLYCSNNQLESLDISSCNALTSLECNNNQLTTLDISKCPNLIRLFCTNSNMKDISAIIGDTSNIEDFQFDPQNSDAPTQALKKAQKMTVKPGSLELYVGGSTKNLKVSNTKVYVTYISSDTKIVKVNSKGKVTSVSKGKTYITVKAAGDSTYESASKKINVTVYGKPAKVEGVKVSPAKAKRTVKVSWKKAPSVSGYIIKYSYNKNMKNSETVRVNKGSTTSKTIKKLTSKKYVYIQVQAYIKDGSALIKGAWSTKTRSSGKIR